MNDLYRRLVEAHGGGPETPQPGHLTTEQWADKWGLKRPRTSQLIRAGIKAGILGVKVYRIKLGKLLRPVPHYFEKKQERRKA